MGYFEPHSLHVDVSIELKALLYRTSDTGGCRNETRRSAPGEIDPDPEQTSREIKSSSAAFGETHFKGRKLELCSPLVRDLLNSDFSAL